MLELKATARFEKDFKKLEAQARKTIADKVVELKASPYLGKRLHGPLKAYRSLRCGAYHVLYSVDEGAKTVFLEHCDHRKRVYD